jgi:hypothetical protein
MLRLLSALTCLLLAMSVQASELPADFEAHYEVHKAGFKVGQAERMLKRQSDGQLHYQSNSRTAGLVAFFASEKIRESSVLEIHEGNVRTLSYDKRRDGRRQRHVVQAFDWQNEVLRSRINDEQKELPLQQVVLDQSAYQLRLMVDLARGEREMAYTIASNSRLNEFKIRHLRDETIKTPLGKLETVLIRSTDGKVTTLLWCAKDLDFLPVQIEHEEKGVSFTAKLVSHRYL